MDTMWSLPSHYFIILINDIIHNFIAMVTFIIHMGSHNFLKEWFLYEYFDTVIGVGCRLSSLLLYHNKNCMKKKIQ